MTIPATAGRYLTEERLRAFTQCSEFYEFGGKATGSYGLEMVRHTIEGLTSLTIRDEARDPLAAVTKLLQRSARQQRVGDSLMDAQARDLVNKCILWTNDFFELFPFSTYIPVYGPLEYTVKVSKTPVRLHVSGVYRTIRNQTLHVVVFSPYPNLHSMINDPTIHLKLQTLKRFVAPHYTQRAQCKVHILGMQRNNELLYHSLDTSEANPDVLPRVEQLIKLMESGYHYPVVPCKHQCPYKRQCNPGLKENK